MQSAQTCGLHLSSNMKAYLSLLGCSKGHMRALECRPAVVAPGSLSTCGGDLAAMQYV